MNTKTFEKIEELTRLKLKLDLAEEGRLSGDNGISIAESKKCCKNQMNSDYNRICKIKILDNLKK